MDYREEYIKKLITAEQGAALVKSGDYVVYSDHALFPASLDRELAKRAETLLDVAVRTLNPPYLPEFVKIGIDRAHITWIDRHYNGIVRAAHKRGIVNYMPGTYYMQPTAYEGYSEADTAFIEAAPMDKHGFFNIGLANSEIGALLKNAKCIVVETNANVPVCYGGNNEAIHISGINYIVEGDNRELLEISDSKASIEEEKIAQLIINELENGSCLQLGIGSLPNAIGNLIAQSDLKKLGIHTEMLTDACLNLYESGKVTGQSKAIDKGKIAYTFALGSKSLYEFLDHNPVCASYPVNYINNPAVISSNDQVVSINNALEVDLFTQVSSESMGADQISGTGGQMDFTVGASNSKGGKAFICLTSTFTDKTGATHSRIRPTFNSASIVTLPRSLSHHIVTEYGIAQLKGKSTWGRAEALIKIAHPDYRDELIKEAEKLKIWTYTNKKI